MSYLLNSESRIQEHGLLMADVAERHRLERLGRRL